MLQTSTKNIFLYPHLQLHTINLPNETNHCHKNCHDGPAFHNYIVHVLRRHIEKHSFIY